MPPGPTTSTTAPDWLHAAATTDGAPEPERIALRSNAPAPRGPTAPKVEEKKPVAKAAAPTEAVGPKLIDIARYPSRLMLAETVTMAAVAAAWIMALVPMLPTRFQSMEAYSSLPGAFGLFQLVRWVFRVYGGGYSLTAKQMLRVNPGPIPDPEPIELPTIATIAIEQTLAEWLMFAGRLRLHFERESQEDIVLGPVGWPRRRSQILQQTIDAARAGNVVSARVVAGERGA